MFKIKILILFLFALIVLPHIIFNEIQAGNSPEESLATSVIPTFRPEAKKEQPVQQIQASPPSSQDFGK